MIQQLKTVPVYYLTVPVGSPGFLSSESHKTKIQVSAARTTISSEGWGPIPSSPVASRL